MMKAYKGFNKDMTCRGFQYEEGKEYTTDTAEMCSNGFHACEKPLDCFSYYNPGNSVFHEVELDATDETSGDDSKRVGKRIKIGARLNIAKMVDASIEYVNERIDKEKANSATGDRSANSATGDGSANSATGDRSANSATGDRSANSATGNWSANSATGYGSANSATGYGSANSATGDGSANSATGYGSANSATGDRSANSATGYGSANVSTGYKCKNEGGIASINVGWGHDNICKGDVGSYIVLSEWGDFDGNKRPLIGAKMGYIDGITLKPDTWYTLKDGEFVEVDE